MRFGKMVVGLSSLASIALSNPSLAQIQPPPPGPAPKAPVTWAPDVIPSIIEPSQNTSQDAWAPYRGRIVKPSVDRKLDDPVLRGAIDIHAHFGPDTYDRQWDVFQIARRAQEHGMRGLVIKSHWTESSGLAYLVRKYATPGLEVWGGLVLNTPEGGINPMAVRAFAETEGNYGKVVWMPTHDSEHEVTYNKENRPYVRVSKDGVLLPQVLEVLDLIAQYKLTLATGHVYPKEMLQIVGEAKKRGIDHIIITHPGLGPMFTDPTIDELKQAVRMGGYVEVVSTELLMKGTKDTALDAIRAIGPEHYIISTDSGLTGTPNHTDALVMAAGILRQAGFSEDQLNMMFKRNPALVLGLPAR